jgi:hypothetical protein
MSIQPKFFEATTQLSTLSILRSVSGSPCKNNMIFAGFGHGHVVTEIVPEPVETCGLMRCVQETPSCLAIALSATDISPQVISLSNLTLLTFDNICANYKKKTFL